MKVRKTRHLTLLEVLIALLLVMMSLPIFISSFAFTSIEQQKMINSMTANRAANHAFAVIYEDLATHKITYSMLEAEREYPFEERHLNDASGRWSGKFRFNKLKPDKPKKTKYHVELWEAVFDFVQAGSKEPKHFAYNFIVIRDLTGTIGQGEKNKGEENAKK